MHSNCHPLLVPMIPVVDLLGKMLGEDYEILLHDLSKEEPFIVAIANGHVTGRNIHSKMTDLGYFLMTSLESQNLDFLANYPSEAENGKALRSGVVLIRNEDRVLIGFLCINFDMTRGHIIKDMGEFLTNLQPLSFKNLKSERFVRVSDLSPEEIIDKMRQEFGKNLNYLNRTERVKCIEMLDHQGFFNLKGSVMMLSRIMGKSRYTIYADLRNVRMRKS